MSAKNLEPKWRPKPPRQAVFAPRWQEANQKTGRHTPRAHGAGKFFVSRRCSKCYLNVTKVGGLVLCLTKMIKVLKLINLSTFVNAGNR
jgi:hypothetical protein